MNNNRGCGSGLSLGGGKVESNKRSYHERARQYTGITTRKESGVPSVIFILFILFFSDYQKKLWGVEMAKVHIEIEDIDNQGGVACTIEAKHGGIEGKDGYHPPSIELGIALWAAINSPSQEEFTRMVKEFVESRN